MELRRAEMTGAGQAAVFVILFLTRREWVLEPGSVLLETLPRVVFRAPLGPCRREVHCGTRWMVGETPSRPETSVSVCVWRVSSPGGPAEEGWCAGS